MFSKISQIGKNLSEEISRINDEVNSDTNPQNASMSRSASLLIKGANQQWSSKFGAGKEEPERPVNAKAILSAQTPNPDDLQQPSDEESPETTSSATPPATEEPSRAATPEKNLLYVPQTSIRYSELQPEIRSKIRKFLKYEEKYPLLLDSYRAEKKKSVLIDGFEKVLRELTPVSSIGEIDGFKGYIEGLSAKSELLNRELAKVTSESKREIRELRIKLEAKPTVQDDKEVEKLQKEIEELKKELEESHKGETDKASKLEAVEAEKIKLSKAVEDLEGKTTQLSRSVEELEGKSDEVEELKKTVASKEKLISLFKEKLSKAGEDGGSDSGEAIELKHQCEKLTAENEEHVMKLAELQGSYRSTKAELGAKSEEVDNLKDMLRDLGDDLVSARDEIKQLKERPAEEGKVDDLKAELETLRIQHSEAVTNYEKSLRGTKETKSRMDSKVLSLEQQLAQKDNELTQLRNDLATRTKNLETITKDYRKAKSETDKLSKDVEILKHEKQLLEKRVAELESFKSKDVNLKLDLSSVKSSLNLKERQLAEAESKANYLEKEKESLNDKLVEIRVQVAELTSTNKSLMEAKNEAVTKTENLRQEYNEMMVKFNKMGTENNRLVKNIEELKDRYSNVVDAKYDSGEQLDSLKKRCEELTMRAREAEIRVDMLEEELTESRTMLQERNRETGTIRKLLTDAENATNHKLREMNLKLESVMEEKERLQSESAQSVRRKQRELDDLKLKTQDLQDTVRALQEENETLSEKMNRLVVEKSQSSHSGTEGETGELSHIIENLRDALSHSEKRAKEYENMNVILKKVSDETSLKLERMNKNYKLLSQQLRLMKERKASISSQDSRPVSPASSRHNSVTVLNSMTTPTGESETVKERTEYIRNVLLGFLEHREQRQQLLPVVKTLLELNGEDEDRFLSALAK